MVDFRYHLVSLIAVFLALAVGVVLGSGPLATGIGNSLSGDLADVREERDQLEADLAAQISETDARDAALTALAADAAEGTLAGQHVAVVVLPGADPADVSAASDAITGAGATVSTATFTDAWQETDQAFLQSYAGQLAGYVDVTPGTRPEAIVAAALGEALRDVGVEGSDAAILAELLSTADVDYVAFEPAPAVPATAALVVGPRVAPDAVDGAAEIDPAAMVSGLAAALPSVTVGATDGDGGGLVDVLRAADVVTSTVDSVGEATATASIPFALAAELAGTHGHYGSQTGANAPVPALP